MITVSEVAISKMVINKVESATKAFFDIVVAGVILIKDMKIVMNTQGQLFVSYPQKPSKDKSKYFNTVWIQDVTLRDEIQKLAISSYSNIKK